MYDYSSLGGEEPPVWVPGSGLTSGPDCAEADDLRSQVSELSGTLNVATAKLVDMIVRVIEIDAWTGAGYRSIEHWVRVHCGVSRPHAEALVRMARRSASFPVTMGMFREGRLSEDQVRPIVRHAPDGYDGSVAQLAEYTTVPQLERTMRRYRFGDDKPPTAKELNNPDSNDDGEDRAKAAEEAEQRAERERAERQYCSFGHDNDDGFWFLKARLTPEQGEIVQKALQVFRQDIFNERDGKATWHDALVRMADTALAAHGDVKDRRGHDRYQVMVHMRAETLDTFTSTELMPPSTYFHLGPAVSQSLAKYMSCDASVRTILERDGRRVSVGRKYRTVPDHTRRVVEDRDGGRCIIPGCTSTLGIEVHHLVHWEDGGGTDTANLACTCSWCHPAIHRGEINITGNADVPNGAGLTITDRRGRPLTTKPKAPKGPLPAGNWTHPTGEPLDPACIWFKKNAA